MPAQFYLALDIGGTKICSAVVACPAANSLSILPRTKQTCATPRGQAALARTIAQILTNYLQLAARRHFTLAPCLAIGAPGRFGGPEQNIIAPGTALNLEAFPGEMDGANLTKILSTYLPTGYQVAILNDAIAQLMGGLSLLSRQHGQLLAGQKVFYVGPGTGLGGGFAEISTQGHVQIKTDGHIADLQILDPSGQPARSEDWFSGGAFSQRNSHTLQEINACASLRAQYQAEITQLLHYGAQIMRKIHLGEIVKMQPENNWPASDIAAVRGVSIFLLGGSIGTKGVIGRQLRQTLRTEFKKAHLPLRLLRITQPEKAALLGAVLATQKDWTLPL